MLNFTFTAALQPERFIRYQTIIILFVGLFLSSCSDKKENTQPELKKLPVLSIYTNTARTIKEYPSSIEGINNVEIRSEVSGKLQKVFVDEGAYVQKGQLLFQIDGHSFQERLNNAKAVLRMNNGALNSAKIEVEKLIPLVKNNVVSSYQLKVAQATKEMAEGNLEQARANVRAAQIELSYTFIKAPSTGYLGRLSKKVGSIISPGDTEPMAMLSDIHKVHAYFSMSEVDFLIFKSKYEGKTIEDKLKKLPAVSLILSDKSKYNIDGHIDMVDGQFDKNTGAVTLRATFDNPNRDLRSGNTGKIQLGMIYSNIAVVPQDATIEMQDKIFVFTVGQGNKLSKKPITVSGKNDEDYYISDGIQSGTKIITSGIELVTEGEKIIPQKHVRNLKTASATKYN